MTTLLKPFLKTISFAAATLHHHRYCLRLHHIAAQAALRVWVIRYAISHPLRRILVGIILEVVPMRHLIVRLVRENVVSYPWAKALRKSAKGQGNK